jgi:hypothetical protein
MFEFLLFGVELQVALVCRLWCDVCLGAAKGDFPWATGSGMDCAALFR